MSDRRNRRDRSRAWRAWVACALVSTLVACTAPVTSDDASVAPSALDARNAPPTSCARRDRVRTAPTTLFDTFKEEISRLPIESRAARVDELLAEVRRTGGAPLEDRESDRVVFLARGRGSLKVAGSFNGWSATSGVTMRTIEGTDLAVADVAIPRGASFEYKLVSGATFFEDPLANNVTWDGIDRGFGARGEMNAVGHPAEASMERGRLVAVGKVHATKLGDDRDVWVYLPAAFDSAACPKLPSIVFHDGLESLTRGGFAEKADALYASKPELAAVLVFVGLPNQDVRMAQYTFAADSARGPDYVDFLANDLWASLSGAVDSSRVCSAAAARGIAGESLGGLISTFAAFERPREWGWVGAQSASYFWADNAMITRVSAEPARPLRLYLDSGCPNDNCVVTDEMSAALTAKGYDHVRVTDQGAAHDWRFWRVRLPGLLTHFREGQTSCD